MLHVKFVQCENLTIKMFLTKLFPSCVPEVSFQGLEVIFTHFEMHVVIVRYLGRHNKRLFLTKLLDAVFSSVISVHASDTHSVMHVMKC